MHLDTVCVPAHTVSSIMLPLEVMRANPLLLWPFYLCHHHDTAKTGVSPLNQKSHHFHFIYKMVTSDKCTTIHFQFSDCFECTVQLFAVFLAKAVLSAWMHLCTPNCNGKCARMQFGTLPIFYLIRCPCSVQSSFSPSDKSYQGLCFSFVQSVTEHSLLSRWRTAVSVRIYASFSHHF